jgi:cytochrome bd-type quinol oxidase subunit 2
MFGTTDQLTAAIPGSYDSRVTICSIVSFFWPEVTTPARTVVRSVPSMSSLRIDCKPKADYVIVARSNIRDITIYNAATGEYPLRVGLIWWGLGMCLAFGYFVFVYRMFRGKVRLEQGHEY